MQWYLKIQAALPALQVLPGGQDPVTCLAPKGERAAARECVDVEIQQSGSGEQINPALPFSVSIPRH